MCDLWGIGNEQNHKELCPKWIYSNDTTDFVIRKTAKQKSEKYIQNENEGNLNNVKSFHGLEYERGSVLHWDKFLVREGNVWESIKWFLNPIVYDRWKETPLIVLEKINLLKNSFGDSLILSFMVLIKLNTIHNIIKTLSRNGTERIRKWRGTDRNNSNWWKGAYSWAYFSIIIGTLHTFLIRVINWTNTAFVIAINHTNSLFLFMA